MNAEETQIRLELAEAKQLITDLHAILRWMDVMEIREYIIDPSVHDGADFTFWADECAKNLGVMNAGNVGDLLRVE